ncbi:DUF481 domain-containing protein [Vibrio hippocampi]|uniref:DUF481 domain-containing protein n=1 Tax=Vibrio hippocampi TaxID=654686 RepID=UPI003F4A3E56
MFAEEFSSTATVSATVSATDSDGDSDETSPPPKPLHSEIEFGYQSHSGNTDSQSLNARIAAEYIEGRHRTSGEWKYYQLYKDGEEDKNQHNYLAQSDYKLGPRSYLYGNYNGVSSLYNSYYEDHTLSIGFGYQLSNTEQLLLEFEAGPGYRYQEPNLDEIDDDDIIFPNTVKEAIVRANLNLVWNPLATLSFGSKLTVTMGDSNSRYDTELNATNAITETIALKIVYSSQYHDKVPGDLSKNDSIFTVNLLFKF